MKQKQQGFTLIELSIVLVIIGLIVGAVIVGQDMIKAAEIRSTIAQLEGYNTASNTFRDKYRYIPGDITSSYATQFGFISRSGTTAHGDGNDVLEGCNAGIILHGCEIALFWSDLGLANLIAAVYSGTDILTVSCTNSGACQSYVPLTKLGQGNMVTVFSTSGNNYYEIHGISDITAGVYTFNHAMNPQEAFNIDQKLDDGSPFRGIVRAMAASTSLPNATAVAAGASAGVCVENANNTYNTEQEDYATSLACGLRFRMQ